MQKKVKDWLPKPDKIIEHKQLRRIKHRLGEYRLWHVHRRSVARAVAIGLFTAFIPLPCQMLIAALFSIRFIANVPVAVALVWLSNPITMPPLYYYLYCFGEWVLQRPTTQIDWGFDSDLVMANLQLIWEPLFVGIILCATTCAALGFLLTRLIWRWRIVRRWKNR